MNPARRQRLLWLSLFTLILVPRLATLVLLGVSDRPIGELEKSAACLAAWGYLGEPYIFGGGTGPSAHVGPLYAGFLGGVYSLFGSGTLGHTVQALGSIAVMTLGIALLVPLGRALFCHGGVGWLAAAAMAVLPLSMHFLQVSGSWEQHWSFTAAQAYLLHMLHLQRTGWNRPGAGVLFGLTTGVCTLLHPPFALAAGLFALQQFCLQPQRGQVVRQICLAGFTATLVLAPWQVRNYRVLGGWCFIRSNIGLELNIGNNDEANGFTQVTCDDDPASPFRRRHPLFDRALFEDYRSRGELAFMAEQQRQALEWITANPERFLELTIIRVRLFWFPGPVMWSAQKAGRITPQIRAALYSGINAGALVGWLLLWRRQPGAAWATAALLLGFSAPYAVTHVELRYLFPLHGICLTLGCGAAVSVAQNLRACSGARSQ